MGLRHKLAVVLATMAMAAAGTCYAADKVENPEYKQWAKFKVGSSVTFTSENPAAGRPSIPNTRTVTLLEVTPEKVVVGEKHTSAAAADADARRIDIPAKIEKAESPAANDPKVEVKESAEEIDVAGAKVKCKVIETTSAGSRGIKLISKIWTSDDVPGGLVRSVMPGNVTTITAMTIK